MHSKRIGGSLHTGARMSAASSLWKPHPYVQQKVQRFIDQKKQHLQLISAFIFKRHEVQLQNSLHKIQVHYKVSGRGTTWFQRIGYCIWQYCRHNSRKVQHWWLHIFDKVGRFYWCWKNFALDPCKLIGDSSGHVITDYAIPSIFVLENTYYTLSVRMLSPMWYLCWSCQKPYSQMLCPTGSFEFYLARCLRSCGLRICWWTAAARHLGDATWKSE